MTVDIIMPCYYSNDIIRPALDKIANQTVVDQITLIMVNDCSPNTDCEYQDLIQEYSNKIKIRYFKTLINSGPGIARQLGLNNAISDWVLFQDDDDELESENTIEQLLTASKNYDLTNLFCISGSIKFSAYFLEKDEIWYPQPCSVQGSLFNRILLQKLNISFEPDLSFKEEDGAFSTLAIIKSTKNKYNTILIDNIIYIRKRIENHLSVTGKSTALESFIALLGTKAYQVKYLIDNNITNAELYLPILQESISFIPNLVQNLIFFLEQYFNYKLSLEQYHKLQNYIKLYQSGLKYYHFNLNEINFYENANISSGIFSFDNQNFFGAYSPFVILNFDELYPLYISYINNKLLQK